MGESARALSVSRPGLNLRVASSVTCGPLRPNIAPLRRQLAAEIVAAHAVVGRGEGAEGRRGQGSCAGDLNGDGFADLVVGAPGFLPPPGLAGLPGRVTVILEDPGRLARERLLIAGPQVSDFFGFAVTARNDIDGDGYSDLVVGAPITDDTLGAIYVYRGGPSPSINADLALRGTVPGSQFGRYIAATGDLDGDGLSDLAVGAPALYSNTPSAPRGPAHPLGNRPGGGEWGGWWGSGL